MEDRHASSGSLSRTSDKRKKSPSPSKERKQTLEEAGFYLNGEGLNCPKLGMEPRCKGFEDPISHDEIETSENGCCFNSQPGRGQCIRHDGTLENSQVLKSVFHWGRNPLNKDPFTTDDVNAVCKHPNNRDDYRTPPEEERRNSFEDFLEEDIKLINDTRKENTYR